MEDITEQIRKSIENDKLEEALRAIEKAQELIEQKMNKPQGSVQEEQQ